MKILLLILTGCLLASCTPTMKYYFDPNLLGTYDTYWNCYKNPAYRKMFGIVKNDAQLSESQIEAQCYTFAKNGGHVSLDTQPKSPFIFLAYPTSVENHTVNQTMVPFDSPAFAPKYYAPYFPGGPMYSYGIPLSDAYGPVYERK
jgi:hypothetical protein